MKKLLLAAVALLAISTSAYAEQPKFQETPNFSLECESNFQDRHLVVLDILPSENMIKLHNDKGEEFTFPVTRADTNIAFLSNEFGHRTKVTYPQLILFQDKGGRSRVIHYHRILGYRYFPAPGNDEKWGYTCVVL